MEIFEFEKYTLNNLALNHFIMVIICVFSSNFPINTLDCIYACLPVSALFKMTKNEVHIKPKVNI